MKSANYPPTCARLIQSLLATIVLLGTAGNASEFSLVSPEQRVSMVELFTSHGCSSCPPADAWLRTFTEHPGLWKEVIPLAFHVDYWDRLGWPDRFATQAHTQRQVEYRSSDRLSSIYTPGIVVAGQEWRGWFGGGELELTQGPVTGRLYVELDKKDQAHIRYEAAHGNDITPEVAHLAVLGFGLTTPIHGGENRGRDLKEDFVVLGYRTSDTMVSDLQWRLPMPEMQPAESTRLAVVAWVSNATDPVPVQSVGGWLP